MTEDPPISTTNVEILRWLHATPSERATSTDGRIVYAVGDIHGCYVQLAALLEAIVADVEAADVGLPPLLVFCGDYVDRGPQSANVLTALIWLARHAAVDVVFLRGNHEVMLLDFVEHPEQNLAWLQRDGESTLSSYGVPLADIVPSALDEECFRLRDRLLDRMPASHLEWLRELPVTHMCGDYVFVHAGMKPGVPLSKQDEEDCLWIGKDFLQADYRFEKVVVHGHSWSSEAPVVTANRIGIDTGAYATGVLSAVRFEGPRIAFLQARLRGMGETTVAFRGPQTSPGGL